jgi:hypothetical protein
MEGTMMRYNIVIHLDGTNAGTTIDHINVDHAYVLRVVDELELGLNPVKKVVITRAS